MDFRKNSFKQAENKTTGFAVPTQVLKPPPKRNSDGVGSSAEGSKTIQVISESINTCELKFGSYCLWRQHHTEKMKDFIVKKMKDQLYVARAYYPSIAKLPALDQFSQEMKQNIQEFERILSESSADTDLPPQVEKKMQKMETTITKAKSAIVDCTNVDKKLRQLVDLTEDEANFHMKQSAFLYQLAVQTTPKSLHCLSMRLTVEYFRTSPVDADLAHSLLNPDLHHYVMFSNNVLAASVVINSTVMHARASEKQVFHVLTDKQSYFSIKMWFFSNTYKHATIQVLNIDDLNLLEAPIFSPLSTPQELRLSFQSFSKTKTEYISIFSHLHYTLPKIFPSLKKIIVLDDDIIVQRDMSALWDLDMDGKVIGALQLCTVKLGAFGRYLGKEKYDGDTCMWMSGLNVIDLVRWRERNVTGIYRSLVQKRLTEPTTTLLATMLTFQGLLFNLDNTWVLSGLGHNYDITPEAINKAAVLHFNGIMKPWLELGILSYKPHWRKYLNHENRFLTECNVNP